MSVDASRCGIFHVILYHFIYAYAALDMCLVNAFVCVHVMRTNHGILPISFLLSPIFFLYFPSLSHGFSPFSNFFPLSSPFPFAFPLFSLILPSLYHSPIHCSSSPFITFFLSPEFGVFLQFACS